ncbi:glycyl-radical enzyme activating protein [Halanaerobium hydrogeniformans]|uniref:Glycyl-radical enzyme activating protein family n=1 Tax=Halanaerobium hydrogeniformans TaxID=656519 RepID=E4RMV9_HALHG|nr:glycyl-radical enzyme activating protein [Halanaerobium hydrogeniformans]ADQ14176.1 glycyl-radical enzyme activating protein family [Halanaerobium hydrogeniformans]
MNDINGNVFNIQRYTVHDGPGIRTEIFLKGCSLKCLWCCNPESFNKNLEIGVYPDKCIGIDKCGYCLEACSFPKEKIFEINENNAVESINRELCTNCLRCAEVCPGDVIITWGEIKKVSEVIEEVSKDKIYYDESGGGITISGGELLVQWEFALELLKESKRLGINTCIETTLYAKWNIIEQLLDYSDLLITDIKHMNAKKHKEFTGVSNKLILENIIKVSKEDIPYLIRIPMVPDHVATEENMRETAKFIKEELKNMPLQIQLLPFHEYGQSKYNTLGMSYLLKNYNFPERKTQNYLIESLHTIMLDYQIPVVIGSTNKLPLSKK